MKRLLRQNVAARQHGIAAIELAILLPVLMLMLTGVLFFSRYFWHYSVLQKAARDGALLVSGAPKLDMSTPSPLGQVAIVPLAVAIMQAEVADLYPGGIVVPPDVLCQGQLSSSASSLTWTRCNGAVAPMSVKASLYMFVTDPFFGQALATAGGSSGLMVAADVTMPYVGN